MGIYGGLSAGFSQYSNSGGSTFNFSLSPSYLYFIADNLALSPSLTTFYSKSDNQHTLSFTVNGGATYYIGTAPLKPFALARIGYYTARNYYSFGTYIYDEILLTGGIGLAYFFTNSVALSGTVYYYHYLYNHSHDETYTSENFAIGFTYILPK